MPTMKEGFGIPDEAQRTTLEKVRVLQRKLYRAAKAQPQRTFGVLFDKVCSLEVSQPEFVERLLAISTRQTPNPPAEIRRQL